MALCIVAVRAVSTDPHLDRGFGREGAVGQAEVIALGREFVDDDAPAYLAALAYAALVDELEAGALAF